MRVLIVLMAITTASFGATIPVDSWTFDGGSLEGASGRVISGTTNSAGLGNGANRFVQGVVEGAVVNPGADADAITLGVNGSSGWLNTSGGKSTYIGPVYVQGTSAGTVAVDEFVNMHGTDETVKLTLNLNGIDASTGITDAFRFGIRLRDHHGSGFVGLSIMDNYSDDRFVTVVTCGTASTNVVGGKHLTGGFQGQADRRIVDWTTARVAGETNLTLGAHSMSLELDFSGATGIWTTVVNGKTPQTGTFDKDVFPSGGINRYQIEAINWTDGDYVEIDEVRLEAFSADAEGYYVEKRDGEIIGVEATGIAHTNGNMSVVFYGDAKVQDTFVYDSDPVIVSATETTTIAGIGGAADTNATKLTSWWEANTSGTVEYWVNVGGTNTGPGATGNLRPSGDNNGDYVFTAPGTNDNLKIKSATTALVIDSDVVVASVSGEGKLADGGPAVLTVAEGGSLTVRGSSPLVPTPGKSGSGFTYMDNKVQIGAYGQGDGTHAMTVNVDGGSLDTDTVSVGHSWADGTLNVTNNGALNVADVLYVGYEQKDVKYSTGIMNQSSGTTDVYQVRVGSGGEGILNISGGDFNITSNGTLRVGDFSSGENAAGTVNLSGGSLNLASNVTAWIGYNDEGGATYTGAVSVSGGTLNLGDNALEVGRLSDGVLSVSGDGVVNVVDANINLGHQGVGTLNIDGGTINSTITYTDTTPGIPAVTVGAWGGGTGIVNITDGTLNIDGNLYINNINPALASSNHAATVTQTGGTVNMKGGELRIGNNGPATYTIGGGESLATISANPTAAETNSQGNATSSIVISQSVYDGTLNIGSNALVHVNQIKVESTPGHATSDGAESVLNLDGGTLLLEANWTGAVDIDNDGVINISEGALIWAGGQSKVDYVETNLVDHITLTGGLEAVPSDDYQAVFTQGDYTLYASVYNQTNLPASSPGVEMQAGLNYARFVSVAASSEPEPTEYEAWLSSKGLSDGSSDGDSDGKTDLLEYALNTDPASSDDSGISSARSGNNILFVHPKRSGIDHGLVYTVETNDNLKVSGGWGSHSVVSSDDATESVSHTISSDDDDNLFIRLKVELAE